VQRGRGQDEQQDVVGANLRRTLRQRRHERRVEPFARCANGTGESLLGHHERKRGGQRDEAGARHQQGQPEIDRGQGNAGDDPHDGADVRRGLAPQIDRTSGLFAELVGDPAKSPLRSLFTAG
jgi:hypothetical protein